MPTVDTLLEGLAEAARNNEKSDFDRLERELLAHYDGGFEGMPDDVYQRYLDVDRHWPISVESPGAAGGSRTVELRLSPADRTWLEDLAVATDRSLSAVVAACLDAVRRDPSLEGRIREALERARGGS